MPGPLDTPWVNSATCDANHDQANESLHVGARLARADARTEALGYRRSSARASPRAYDDSGYVLLPASRSPETFLDDGRGGCGGSLLVNDPSG